MTSKNPCTALAKRSPTEVELRRSVAIAWRSHWQKFWWTWPNKKEEVLPVKAINSLPVFIDGSYSHVGPFLCPAPSFDLKRQDAEPVIGIDIPRPVDDSSFSKVLDFIKDISAANTPTACKGCSNYYGQAHGRDRLVCAMYPRGVDGDTCESWEPGENKQSFRDDRHFHTHVYVMNVSTNNQSAHGDRHSHIALRLLSLHPSPVADGIAVAED
ncbi:MAG: hypothetical protein HC852_11225 [Acaryochloridaceae cyanobacterium RU_4_10]|nr:hypothetical protein [Acaryochloridaceae cyanobacterium RU_4_10]